MNTVSKTDLFISATGSLFEKVTPNLRRVIVTTDSGVFSLNFYYDKPLSEEEEELVSLAYTEFVSDVLISDFTTDCRVFVIPYPSRICDNIGDLGVCVYARYEPPYDQV